MTGAPEEDSEAVRRALREHEAEALAYDPAQLRRRILAAARPALATRASRAARGTNGVEELHRWVDVTARFARITLPASLAVAAAGIALLLTVPRTGGSDRADDRTSARTADLGATAGDAVASALFGLSRDESVTVQWMLPSADAVLVGRVEATR